MVTAANMKWFESVRKSKHKFGQEELALKALCLLGSAISEIITDAAAPNAEYVGSMTADAVIVGDVRAKSIDAFLARHHLLVEKYSDVGKQERREWRLVPVVRGWRRGQCGGRCSREL